MGEPRRKFWPIVPPTMHFMALAPLDVWLRLLFRPLARIEPRYWLRLFIVLLSSTLATLVTLPERLTFWLLFKLVKFRPESLPGPVFVLGHYRSGTTHLHYLLDCDPALFTPKWFHTLAPQGFVVSWTFLRAFLIPFMSGSRPMDAMDVGPEYPAEDHFAVNNWCGASTLPGKTTFPQMIDFYDRFNLLQQVTPAELSRWQRFQLAFLRKLAVLAGSRRLLLKSPSHTAHVDRLLELLAGVPGVKFIHITRQPDKVLRSNIWMHQVFQRIWNLQDAQTPEEMEENLLQEYLQSEASFLRCRQLVPERSLVQIRMQDLHADPLGVMRRAYADLDLPFTPAFESRMVSYLNATRDFRPNQHSNFTPEQEARLKPRLEPLLDDFNHRAPTIPKVEVPHISAPSGSWQSIRGSAAWVVALLVAGVCVALWWGLTLWTGAGYAHAYRMVWPVGLAVGYAAQCCAGRGSTRLGAWASGLTLLSLAVVGLAATHFIYYAGQSPAAAQLWTTALLGASSTATSPEAVGLISFHALFWAIMGSITAYRLASAQG